MNELLFVYGTLRRAAGLSQHAALLQQASFVTMASYQGRLYQISHYPGVVPSDNPAELVLGELYRLPDNQQILTALDRYEECSAEFSAPQLYRRLLQPVVLEKGHRVMAWVYVYNRSTDGLKQIVSGDFLQG